MRVRRFTFNMFVVNTYILWDDVSKDAIIIDPGMIEDKDRDIIDEFIRNNDLNLSHLINTHMHIDHSFGVSYIKEKYKLSLEANSDDQFLAQRIKEQATMFGIPISIEDLVIDRDLKDGDKLLVGNEDLYVLQVPGHSPGSIVLYAPESSFILSGDVLFKSSIGRTDLPGGSYQQLINAINDKLMVLPRDVVVYPGHGLETTIGQELLNNPFL